MSRENSKRWRIYQLILILALIIFCLTVYWKTSYRTIPWWFGCSYAIAAMTFGIMNPPGSLILTILGWLVTQLPLGISKIFSLNLFVGVQATFVVIMVMLISPKLVRLSGLSEGSEQKDPGMAALWLGVTAACLNLALSETMWKYAIQFTPYMLTALFTTFLLWAMLRWWEKADQKNSIRWLFLITLLFGLDFSVHRTNLLLLPGFVIWVFLRNRKVPGRIRTWLVGFAGLFLGLAFHFLIIPISARNPVLNANDPSNLSRFYDYVSLKQFGGGWLFHILPRNASFFKIQVSDYLHFFSVNFFSGGIILAILTILLALIGLLVLWRREWRLSLGLLFLFLCSSLGAVIYFNLPKDFFWPMDRHYLPSFVIFSIFIACGAGNAFMFVFNYLKKYRMVAIPLTVLIVFLIPFRQFTRNYASVNGSKSYFAYDYGQNILQNLDSNAILFVAGDNYWSPFYLQVAENVRPDVTVISPSLMNTSWYVKQTLLRNPELPLTVTEEELSRLGPRLWRDTTVAIPVRTKPDFHQSISGSIPPDSVHIRVQPTVAGQYLLAQDWLLLRMLVENQWQRPIYFTHPPSWLLPYAQLEGLVSRIVPVDSPIPDCSILRENLLKRYSYRGYAESSITIDKFSHLAGQDLFSAFLSLARCEIMRGDSISCWQVKSKLLKELPPESIQPEEELRQRYENLCDSTRVGLKK
jgi:hypothetical protein